MKQYMPLFQNNLLMEKKSTFKLNIKFILNDLEQSLNQNISFNKDGSSLESTNLDAPKILHWFEWGKKKLHFYDILSNSTHSLELDINFKIPSFSRSILLPNGQIYLIGGEEPEYCSRKEVYMYDLTIDDRKLHLKNQMPFKKFDFTI